MNSKQQLINKKTQKSMHSFKLFNLIFITPKERMNETENESDF